MFSRRLNGLANSWAGSFSFGYDALSRRTQLTRPNGITTNYSYDAVSHLLSVLHQAGVNTLDGGGWPALPSRFFAFPVPELWVPRPCVLCKGGYDAACTMSLLCPAACIEPTALIICTL